MNLRIVPRTALLLRDGRPFAAGIGARTLTMPWPSTLHGALRTAIAARAGVLHRLVNGDADSGDPVVGTRAGTGLLSLRGPLIVDAADGLHVPRPLDLEVLPPRGDGKWHLVPLEPVAQAVGDGVTATGDGCRLVPLAPREVQGKVAPDAPAFVPWPWLVQWLARHPASALPMLPAAGRAGVLVHVGRRLQVVLGDSRAAVDGGLFGAERVELAPDAAWWVQADGADSALLCGELTVGGDQGPAVASPAAQVDGTSPGVLPAAVRQAVLASGGCLRVLTLTPTLLADGWRPGAADGPLGELLAGARLLAAVVPRAEPVSGSRLGQGGSARAQPARRAVSPGAVWFYRFPDAAAATGAAEALWFGALGQSADRQRGFGLVVAGGCPDFEALLAAAASDAA